MLPQNISVWPLLDSTYVKCLYGYWHLFFTSITILVMMVNQHGGLLVLEEGRYNGNQRNWFYNEEINATCQSLNHKSKNRHEALLYANPYQ